MQGFITNILLTRTSIIHRHSLYSGYNVSIPSPLPILDDVAGRWKYLLSQALTAIQSKGVLRSLNILAWKLPFAARLSIVPFSITSIRPEPSSEAAGTEPLSDPNSMSSSESTIMKLLRNPALQDPTRTPRFPIVLCHGLYGFDVLGPSAYPRLQLHYWHNVSNVLKKKVGAEIIVTGVPSVGSIESRAQKLHELLAANAKGLQLNFLAHSMGGLDCRHLITHVQPKQPVYQPMSLTTVCSPHRGSPFMDWCRANIGIGDLHPAIDENRREPALPYTLKAPLLSRPSSSPSTPEAHAASIASRLSSLPASLTTLILGMVDAPAYSDLTTSFCNDVFNPNTPPRPDVRYFSVGARQDKMSIFHPLWLPKIIVDESEAAERKALQDSGTPPDPLREWGNDGLVSVQSARYGEWLGVVDGCDHWDTRGANGFGRSWEDDKGGWSQFFGSRKKHAGQSLSSEETTNPPEGHITALGGESEAPLSHTLSQDQVSRARSAAALEWIAAKVPAQAALSALTSIQSSLLSTSEPKTALDTHPSRSQKPKFDLELFYIALARNLYDQGL